MYVVYSMYIYTTLHQSDRTMFKTFDSWKFAVMSRPELSRAKPPGQQMGKTRC